MVGTPGGWVPLRQPSGGCTALGTPRLFPVGSLPDAAAVPYMVISTYSPREREWSLATSVTCERHSVRTVNDVNEQRTTDNNGAARRRTGFPAGLTTLNMPTPSIRCPSTPTHASVQRDSVPVNTAMLGLWGSLYGPVPHGFNH